MISVPAKSILFLAIWILFASRSWGQPVPNIPGVAASGGIITGLITDSSPGRSFAFLSGTTMGCQTGVDGGFRLAHIPPGYYDLVVGHAGLRTQVIRLSIGEGDSLHYDVELMPRLVREDRMSEIPPHTGPWDTCLNIFERVILGEGPNAQGCTIANSGVLHFFRQNGGDTLTARADSVVLVENTTLGYRIRVVLSEFSWDQAAGTGINTLFPWFEESFCADSNERDRRSACRMKGYEESLQHFLAVLYAGRATDAGYELYSGTPEMFRERRGHRILPEELSLESLPGSMLKTLRFRNSLLIEHHRTGEKSKPERVGFLSLETDFAVIDEKGNVLNPLSLEVAGGWAKRGLADLVPLY